MVIGVSPSLVMLEVEDNPADAAFLSEAVQASQTPATIHVVENGRDAMRFLRRETPFPDAPRPDVVVLDLNLPIKNGREVLAEMASDPALNTIPVAILTTSASEAHVCEIYSPGRCVYLSKTADFKQLQIIVRRIAAHAIGLLHRA